MAYVKLDKNYFKRHRQRVLARNVEDLYRGAHEVLTWGEDIVHHFTPDGLAVWVGVSSWRPEELLGKIHKLAFRAFSWPGMRFDGQRHWTLFRISFN